MNELNQILLSDAEVVICLLQQEDEAAAERLLVEYEAGLVEHLGHLFAREGL